MKKIGVISDVHGNIQALTAALNHLENQGCREIIHTGDVLDIGANSRECLQLLLQKNVTCLLGNHDRDFVEQNSAHKPFSHVSQRHKLYVFAQLDGYQQEVAKFPLFVQKTLGGKKVIFEHYCRLKEPLPNGYVFETIANEPSAERFDKMYSHYDCDAVFFGHKHEPCDVVGQRLYVDVGSVGCHKQPLAKGVIIHYDQTHFEYERFELPYDMEKARLAMKNVPDGEYMFDFYYLHKKDLSAKGR